MSTPTTIPTAERSPASGRLVVRMVSGRLVDLEDPDPATIAVEDLAHALARVCRFTGNVTEWWSVADHALLCRELICEAGASELAIAALHHDSHEAIVGDIITPVRHLLGPRRVHALTRRLDEAIAVALEVEVDLLRHPLVVAVDRAAAHLEAHALQGGATGHLLNPAPDLRFAPRTLRSDGPVLAARRFLSTDRRLRGHQQDRDGDG